MPIAETSLHDTQPPAEDRNCLAVIVPLYNEQRTVVELLNRLTAQQCVDQVVIVDDGSTDNSVPLVKDWLAGLDRKLADCVSLVQHQHNRGKGRAIRTGLDHVTCSHVIIQDADLEYDPADIAKLWQTMLSGEADVVYGSRYLDKPQLQKGRWFLQSGVRLLNLLVRMLYGLKLTDEATCYKMFRTQDLRNMNLTCERLEFCPEVTAKAARAGLAIAETPVTYASRGRQEGKKLRLRDGTTAVCSLVGWHSGNPSRSSRRALVYFLLPCCLLTFGWFVGRTLRADRGLSAGAELVQAGQVAIAPSVDDFGSHMEGAINRDFELWNNSSQRIVLGTPVTSCGCTSVKLSTGQLDPGEKAAVHVTVKGEANGFTFSTTFRIPYRTEAGVDSVAMATINGRFTESLSVDPPVLVLTRGASPVPLTLRQANQSSVEPKRVYCTKESVKISGPEKMASGIWQYNVQALSATGPLRALPSEPTTIFIETNSIARPLVKVSALVRTSDSDRLVDGISPVAD
jgi:hypothetical protein